jgi:hypothetical protein
MKVSMETEHENSKTSVYLEEEVLKYLKKVARDVKPAKFPWRCDQNSPERFFTRRGKCCNDDF